MTDNVAFLGRGWSFPPSFTDGGKDVSLVADEEDIQQSLKILLATAPGERVLLEDFGCDLNRFVFETMDRSLANNIAFFVKTALLRYESRITVEKVSVDSSPDSDGLLFIQVLYRIPATNSRFNMVYPFYLTEASAVRS